MMKIIIFISLAAIVYFPGIAQILTVEQLQEKLARQTKADTFRVNVLNVLARRSEISAGMRDSLINESLQLSRRLGYLSGEAIALTVQAQFVADVSLATAISRKAIMLAEKSGSKKTLFWAYKSLGQSMLNTSENIKAIEPLRQALKIAADINDPELIIGGQLGFVDYYRGVITNYPLALQWGLKALRTSEQFNYTQNLPRIYRNIGAVYLLVGDKEKSLGNLEKAVAASRKTGDFETAQYALNDIGEQYRLKGMYPEALKAYGEAALLIKNDFNMELNQSNVADVYQRMGNDSLSFLYAFSALNGAQKLNDTIGIAWIDNILSRAYLHTGKIDSAIYYSAEGYSYAIKTQVPEYIRDNSEALANAYSARNDFMNAFYYYKRFISSRDSILNNEITNKTHLAQFEYDLAKKQAEITALNREKQLQHYLIIGIVLILLFIVASLIVVYRNNEKRKKAYAQLQEQKQVIQTQRDQTNQALSDLKLTQKQLVQSEKMASLGELTAGIAHEIQNPLNFVNNFSELSNELINEMNDEMSKGNYDSAKQIANDVKQNFEKINHHGKRADAIVKGMLQHSRNSSGRKEPTNINALCDEYLRLSYHGLRAKNKTFNADFKTDFDESIGKINIVPQDIGRVILNLLTNAFYAVNEKKNASTASEEQPFKPMVLISTKKIADKVEIKMSDNGNGIKQKIMDKIFQPFFTTKPTGQGTGLGLSLSYDIIKAHGGELKVETAEGRGSEFIFTLPLSA